MKPLWITVVDEEDGSVFEGHQLHWANCFFSNATKSQIEAFLLTPGAINDHLTYPPEEGLCEYHIREMTDEELAKYPEAMEFCIELVKEYGEY